MIIKIIIKKTVRSIVPIVAGFAIQNILSNFFSPKPLVNSKKSCIFARFFLDMVNQGKSRMDDFILIEKKDYFCI